MGIYFDETTDEEDSEFITNAIKEGEITKDFMWPCYGEKPTKKDIVWEPTIGGKVVIDGTPGTLTDKGVSFIMICLMQQKRFISTL